MPNTWNLGTNGFETCLPKHGWLSSTINSPGLLGMLTNIFKLFEKHNYFVANSKGLPVSKTDGLFPVTQIWFGNQMTQSQTRYRYMHNNILE